MSRNSVIALSIGIGFPRVSGDEPWLKGKTETMGAFSPRERG